MGLGPYAAVTAGVVRQGIHAVRRPVVCLRMLYVVMMTVVIRGELLSN